MSQIKTEQKKSYLQSLHIPRQQIKGRRMSLCIKRPFERALRQLCSMSLSENAGFPVANIRLIAGFFFFKCTGVHLTLQAQTVNLIFTNLEKYITYGDARKTVNPLKK